MKRKILVLLGILLFVAVGPLSASARQTGLEPEYHFVVWLHNGGNVLLPLDEHPVVRYSDGDIIVSTTNEQLIYPHIAVRKFTLTDEDDEISEITNTERESWWCCQGDVMIISGCIPGGSVFIYAASGQLLHRYTIASDGTLQIPILPFAKGVYIVKTEDITYKFLKK